MPVPIERLLLPEYLEGLETLPLEELRARRQACHEVETGLSFIRRLIQGRLDIVHDELNQRAAPPSTAGEGNDLHQLVERLPSILAERSVGTSKGFYPEVVAPPDLDERAGELDKIVDAAQLASLGDLSAERLHAIAEHLGTLERSVSDERHQLHERIDTLQTEIVKRYKAGEASVDSLLR